MHHTVVLASAETLSSSTSFRFLVFLLFLSIPVASAANDVIRRKQLTKRSFCTPAANLQLSFFFTPLLLLLMPILLKIGSSVEKNGLNFFS